MILKGLPLVLFALVEIALKHGNHADSDLYPDLSCHAGVDDAVNAKVKAAMVTCHDALKTEAKNKECFQQCMLVSVGVLKVNVRMNKKKSMMEAFKVNYFNTTDGPTTAADLATKIYDTCRKAYKATKKKTCENWTAFYSCVDEILACGSKPPAIE